MSEQIKELHHLVRKVVEFVEQRKLLLTVVVGGGLLALVALGLGRRISSSREEDASARLDAALKLPEERRLAELERLSYRIKGTNAHAWTLLWLGHDYFENQDLSQAERTFELAAASDNRYVAGPAYIGLACVYEEQRDYARARLVLDRALEVWKGSAIMAGWAEHRRGVLDALEKEAQAPAKPEARTEPSQEAQPEPQKD